jgi:two-component system, cell cycle response regulator DivK
MSKRVVVIDDDVNTVKFLTAALVENGYEVDSAYNGKDGFDRIEAVNPDLILLDVMMPKRTGFVLFKQLRRDERFKTLPVIMLTGVAEVLEDLDSDSEDTLERPYDQLREKMRKAIQEMKEDGIVKPDVFIDKPIDPELVIAKVKELIGE